MLYYVELLLHQSFWSHLKIEIKLRAFKYKIVKFNVDFQYLFIVRLLIPSMEASDADTKVGVSSSLIGKSSFTDRLKSSAATGGGTK